MTQRRRRNQPGAANGEALQRLEEEFSLYRQRAQRGQRVPDELRAKVLAVVEGGVTPATVSRRFGVTRTQLERWRAQKRKREATEHTPEPTEHTPEPTILTVVEDKVEATEDEIAVELGIGGWRVSLRLQSQRCREG